MNLDASTVALDEPSIATQARRRLLDNVERWVVVLFLLQMIVRLGWSLYSRGDLSAIVTLPGEVMVVVFLLLRRTTEKISTRPADWLIAFVATVLPTLVVPTEDIPRLIWTPLAIFLAIIGLFVQLHAKICLGRSFGMVAANRGIKRGGPYQFVRHPMYVGYLLGHIAFLGLFPSLWNACLLVTAAVIQVNRILREERILSQDPAYVDYMQSVRYRLLPGVF